MYEITLNMELSESEETNEESIGVSEKTIENMNPNEFFNQTEICYYRKINKFFEKCSNEEIELMIDIIRSHKKKEKTKSKISLRLLDWFVTSYPKKVNISSEFNENEIEIFDVRISYRAHLKSLKKRCFDPFKRSSKFLYNFPGTDYTVETTLCQLNFFKWLFSCDVLPYVEKNLKQLNKEMKLAKKEEKEEKEKKNSEESSMLSSERKKKKPKKSIKVKASKIENCDDVRIVLKFD